MEIEITTSTGVEWYKYCIGKRFKIHTKSRRGGRAKYIVKIEGKQFINGYQYGWVDKEHCKLIN